QHGQRVQDRLHWPVHHDLGSAERAKQRQADLERLVGAGQARSGEALGRHQPGDVRRQAPLHLRSGQPRPRDRQRSLRQLRRNQLRLDRGDHRWLRRLCNDDEQWWILGPGLLAIGWVYSRPTAPLTKSTISSVGAPGVKTSATPSFFSSGMSSAGIVPPTVTTTSPAPCSPSSSTTLGTSVMCAPERIERPTASASSWIAVSAICSGVWWRPV